MNRDLHRLLVVEDVLHLPPARMLLLEQAQDVGSVFREVSLGLRVLVGRFRCSNRSQDLLTQYLHSRPFLSDEAVDRPKPLEIDSVDL